MELLLVLPQEVLLPQDELFLPQLEESFLGVLDSVATVLLVARILLGLTIKKSPTFDSFFFFGVDVYQHNLSLFLFPHLTNLFGGSSLAIIYFVRNFIIVFTFCFYCYINYILIWALWKLK